jgi:hypothetical protein
MPIRLQNLTLDLDEPSSLLARKAAERLDLPLAMIRHIQVVRRAIDARSRNPRFVHTVDLALSDPAAEAEAIAKGQAVAVESAAAASLNPGTEELRGRPVVVGCGPAGLFAALQLARMGYRPLLLERGRPIAERSRDVARFLSSRELDADSNMLFGAGGAGTYSDGKLYSRVRDPRVRSVLETLVAAGAPTEILIEARPHIGTDRLHGIVANLCGELERLGGEIRWRERVDELLVAGGSLRGVKAGSGTIESNGLILAIGGSARDTFEALRQSGLALEPKPFQMGLRIEHPRELIDSAIYGRHAGHPRLGAADYVLAGKSVAAFCVCPGGTLVAACSEPAALCTNGMSAHARDGEFTNAALVATIQPKEFGTQPLSGIEYQRCWERRAFRSGGGDYSAPAQAAKDFLAGRVRALGRSTTYPFGVRPAALERVLPAAVRSAIAAALPEFERRIPGFAGEAAILVGVETRASCPVCIVRDPARRVSVSADGVYPAGEGSGYSSGIMSSAVDGLAAAEALISRFAPPRN